MLPSVTRRQRTFCSTLSKFTRLPPFATTFALALGRSISRRA
jgi:hypothetical protein